MNNRSLKIPKIKWKISWDALDYSVFFMCAATIAFHNMHMLMILAQILCVGLLWVNALTKKNFRISQKLFYYLERSFFFIVWCVLSALWSVNVSGMRSTLVSMLQILGIGSCIILYLDNRIRFERLISILNLSGLILCGRIVKNVPVSALGSDRLGQFIGYSSVGVSNSLIFAAFFVIAWAIERKNKLYFISGFILFVFSWLSGSKKAVLVALIIYPLYFLIRSKNPAQFLKNFFFICLGIAVAVFAVFNIPAFYKTVGYRIVKMLNYLSGEGMNMSTAVRSDLKALAWAEFVKRPVCGIGLSAFEYVNIYKRYAHDNYLELLANVGIVGFVLYYEMFIRMTISSIKEVVRKKRRELAMVLAFMLTFWVSETITISYIHETTQIVIAMCFSLLMNKGLLTPQDQMESQVSGR